MEIAVGSHATGKHQGQHAKYHGQTGHQNGAKACFGGAHGGCGQGHTPASARGSIFRKQDGRLAQQSDEHNQTRLHIDIVFKSPYLGKYKATHQAERHRKNHGKGNEQAFVKCTKNQIIPEPISTKLQKRQASLFHITMSGVETMLPKEKFQRIHRSYIIARNRIISYSNAYIQLEKCSFKMRIGKSYVNRVAEVLDEKYYGND